MSDALDKLNASIVPTKERPYVWEKEGQRFAFTVKQDAFYRARITRKQLAEYKIEVYV